MCPLYLPDSIIDQMYLLSEATVAVLEYLIGLPALSSPRLASNAHDDFFIEAKLDSKFEPLIFTIKPFSTEYKTISAKTCGHFCS